MKNREKMELEIEALEAALPGVEKAEKMLIPLGDGGLATKMADLAWELRMIQRELERAVEAAE